MKCNFTMRCPALGRIACFALLFSGISSGSQAQISLVKWDMTGQLGPTVTPSSNLASNNGKLVSAVGQTSAAFVTQDPCVFTNQVFQCNGWNNGAGTSYFLANFSTVNYSSNTFKYVLTYLSEFGPKNFQTQYSTGSATGPWTNIGSAISFSGTAPNCGTPSNQSISLPAACNNLANVWVRVYTTDNITQTGYVGGPSWDNVEVTGTAMTAPTITTQPSSTTICEGANATFSLVASNAITYQWQFRTSSSGTFANCPSNATYDNETTAALTVNNVTAAMSGYQFQCIVTGGTTPNATSNTVTMTVNAYGTWNGSVNANWDNAANWNCGQVPTAATNVTINSGGTQPVINIASATCANLTINSGATLSFTGTTNQLDVKGTASGAGTLNGTNGKVIFSGTGAQTIPGGTYKDLQMNGSGGKTLAGNASVSGVLTLTNGTITLGSNNLTLTNAATISGANVNSFVVTNGTGMLINQNIGTGGKAGNIIFPIGSSTTSYTPFILNNATGTADNFSALVKNGAFTSYSGTTGSGTISSNVVNKTWFISEGTAGGSNATLQLNWNEADEASGFNRNSCCVSHYTGTAWNAGPLGLAGGVDPYNISRSGITSFSPFGVGSAGSPLPLDLTAFNGQRVKEDVILSWTTANEKAVKSFGIERSANGNQFSTVGTVAAQNLREQTTYSYTDKKAPGSALFYRLKMTDIDGASSYSTVVRIANTGSDMVTLFPNPVKEGVLNIQLNDKVASDVALSITDVAGKVVYTRKITAEQVNGNVIPVSIKALPAGNYVFHISAGGVLISQSKFVKQ